MTQRKDPWHTTTDQEEIARYREQAKALPDYLAREAAMTPEEKAQEAFDQFAMRHSVRGWVGIVAVFIATLLATAWCFR